MVINFIKELIIMLLICLAILLLLGILLYDYVPISKTIPNPVSYTTPDNIKQELADAVTVDENKIILTYEVDSTDLNNYRNMQDYKPGKANPFSSYQVSEVTQTNSTAGESSAATSGASDYSEKSANTSSQTSTKEENTTTSGGTFFQDKGTK